MLQDQDSEHRQKNLGKNALSRKFFCLLYGYNCSLLKPKLRVK